MTHDDALELAAHQLALNGTHAYTEPVVERCLRWLTILPALGALIFALEPALGDRTMRLSVAGLLLAVAILAFFVTKPPARWYARWRLHRTAAALAHRPMRRAGTWYASSLRWAIGSSVVLVLLASSIVSVARRHGKPLEPGDYIGLTLLGLLAVLACFLAVSSWFDHVRFGASRLVPDRATVSGGESVTAVLEATDRLARAREVRFDLVETHATPSGRGESEHVRATTTVPASARQVVPGFTLVPVSLPVPPDARPTFLKSRLGLRWGLGGAYLGYADTEHAWEMRVSADVDGAPYRAQFRVVVTSVVPEAPYAPRPIIIPPSDKARPPFKAGDSF